MSQNIKWVIACVLFVIISACGARKVFINTADCEHVEGLGPQIRVCDEIDESIIEKVKQ